VNGYVAPGTPIRAAISAESRLVAAADPWSLTAEKFRMLSLQLLAFQEQRRIKKLVVTSTIPTEGKSFVSANLSVTLAQQREQKVLLVDGDLRRPVLDKTFGVDNRPGLRDCLLGSAMPSQAIRQIEDLGLWFLPAGTALESPLDAMRAGRLASSLEELSSFFDWIVIDTPPLVPLADTSLWSRAADGILLIARHGTTRKRDLKRGVELLDKSRLLGIVVNSSRTAPEGGYYKRYSAKPKRWKFGC
jgi:capsular exopolysaccharide synthesis family protein